MTKQSKQFLAPAKLNLFLHILGRRNDGYHELQTVFQLLDFGDQMAFEVSNDGILSLHLSASQNIEPDTPLDNNLVTSAAALLRLEAGNPLLGASISLNKRLPSGAGLGGGSSNAATCLTVLNRLWTLNLSTDKLCEIGVKLGADVPVFIRGKSAWAEGIGERLSPVELGNSWYLVVSPKCSVSTVEIFCHEQLTRNSQAIKMADFLAGSARNDCESVTRMLYPEVDQAFEILAQFGDFKMTGTGSSLFASFVSEAAAKKALNALPDNLPGFVAKGIDSLEHSL
ncbi:MAG: 4-(cytidine 5'-diphospho)-2-C-methyl-D-erythritol kinase [Gammaproteobacteria bacterium]|nr:4-(cytidine 5'-diphospho)-2-C-methyl-D-erythritol kinase [Gammaproteobacteria bacterium]